MSFKLGQLVMTAGINERVAHDDHFARMVTKSLNRYLRMDWGDLCEEDRESNDLAVRNGDDRIMASYPIPNEDEKIWIITEWDHSVTTILFPSEY